MIYKISYVKYHIYIYIHILNIIFHIPYVYYIYICCLIFTM